MKPIYRATLETKHFHFEAFGEDAAAAGNAMHRLTEKHCAEYQVSFKLFWDEYRAGLEVRDIYIGGGYRDGQLLTQCSN